MLDALCGNGNSKKFTRSELSHALLRDTHVLQSAEESDADYRSRLLRDGASMDAIAERVMDHIRDALLSGRAVTLFNVGTLKPYLRAGSTYKHPTTGELSESSERVHVRLVLSPNMKEDLKVVTAAVKRKLH